MVKMSISQVSLLGASRGSEIPNFLTMVKMSISQVSLLGASTVGAVKFKIFFNHGEYEYEQN